MAQRVGTILLQHIYGRGRPCKGRYGRATVSKGQHWQERGKERVNEGWGQREEQTICMYNKRGREKMMMARGV